jgi:hypothetical protein
VQWYQDAYQVFNDYGVDIYFTFSDIYTIIGPGLTIDDDTLRRCAC